MKKISQIIVGGILFICLGSHGVSADPGPSLEAQKEWEIKQDLEFETWNQLEVLERSSVPVNRTVSLPTDNDNDGMADDWETANGLDPTDPSDAWLDPDGDKVCNLFEYQLGCLPNSPTKPPVTTVATSGAAYTNIEDALDHVTDGTVIRVAAGTYACNYTSISEQTAMLQGGWNSSFTERNLSLYPAILDGEENDEILYFSFYSDSPVIILDGLNFINGAGSSGAVRLAASGTAVMKSSILDCTFTQSTTSYYGGILSLHNRQSSEADRTIANTLIVSNIGSAIYAQIVEEAYARWRILDCTITDNLSGGDNGCGIDAFTMTTGVLEVEIFNTILWDNAGFEIDIRRNITFDVDYSDIGEINVTQGAVYNDYGHTMDADPRFISNLNFRLLHNSPCIDTGINDIGPFTDLDGLVRPSQGTSLVDIGCYEYYSPTPTPTPSVTPSPTATPTPSPTPSSTPSPTPSLTPFGYKTSTPTPSSTPTPTPTPTPEPLPWVYDYNGDGTSDIGIFRPSSGLWAIRNVTRAYWGRNGDIPVPGDYSGDKTTDIGCYRPSTGYWFIKDLTKVFWGKSGDIPVPFLYPNPSAATRTRIGVYRPSSGLWAIREVTRAYWGKAGGNDEPLPGDYSGDGTADIGCYRPSTGYWFIKDLTKVFWGKPNADLSAPGGYGGERRWISAIFRQASGLWAVRGVSRAYWGKTGDIPAPGDYDGDRTDDIGAYRPSTGYWFIKDLTKVYWGKPGDVPVTR